MFAVEFLFGIFSAKILLGNFPDEKYGDFSLGKSLMNFGY